MNKRKHLGQHFLKSKSLAKTIVDAAKISTADIVLEVGTGLGILTPLLCERAKKVISIEADDELFQKAQTSLSGITNLTLRHGDGFKERNKFTVFVSNLPYSKSKEAIEWLAMSSFSHGVIMVQQEFADKLFADGKLRRAISVIAQHAFDMRQVCKVDKKNFSPSPQVDSVVLRLDQKHKLSKNIIQITNNIFSYRRKIVQNIFKQFGKETTIDKRLDDLSGAEIIEIAKKLSK